MNLDWLGYMAAVLTTASLVAIDSWPIILSNAVTAVLAGTILALKLRYG